MPASTTRNRILSWLNLGDVLAGLYGIVVGQLRVFPQVVCHYRGDCGIEIAMCLDSTVHNLAQPHKRCRTELDCWLLRLSEGTIVNVTDPA
jgi:hypothetical protein